VRAADGGYERMYAQPCCCFFITSTTPDGT
jgi:hypothetical protein